MSAGGTVAKFTCPPGTTSFTGTKTCNNSSGGCDFDFAQVIYGTGDPASNKWSSVATNTVEVESNTFPFFVDNQPLEGGYVTGLICIPSSEVSYWS